MKHYPLMGSIAFTVGAAACFAAHATEGGASSYAQGAETYMAGAMPPPGVYGQLFYTHYEADTLRGNDGSELPVDFDIRVDSVVSRVIWVTDYKIFGGQLGVHILVPLVNLKVSVNGKSQRKEGLGDILFAPALGYHFTDKLHAIFAVDVIAPTGSYDQNDLANTGRNYWVFQPLVALDYLDPNGLNVAVKTMYDFNRKNPATDYRSGQELHLDYSIGWGMGNGWVLGVGGYALHQTTEDRQNGKEVQDNKGRAFAIGPSVKYQDKKGWFITAKWQDERQVRNRAEGSAYWFKVSIPF